ncbi:MAG: histidinol dehydrogenase [Candidatus Marinimicrobia bacterium]|nr:histidinol dehydrogenase [Candidatus Neomarinimicrobiota bacterium]|tara:strand:- start:12139 stop:13422 length:1284 start_codon:yes stop_codon:yes gene_type:complete
MKLIEYKNSNSIELIIKHLNKRDSKDNFLIKENVTKIINNVSKKGDVAIIEYTFKFDKIKLKKSEIYFDLLKYNYKKNIDKNVLLSFKKAINNISKFHKKQLPKNIFQNEKNIKLISQWKPIDSVGLYIPGGNAFYPSSLIMNAVPAIIAGVKRIVCVTPPSKNINPYFCALLKELGINETYFVGGAQAIAALALGTKTIKPVNKIFGPGNAYVAEAKKQLFGNVGIDLIAGPSEIVVVANKNNHPSWVASDLIAQAEHDINSKSILITDNKEFAKKVLDQINLLKKLLTKKNIISKSLKNNGLIILVKNLNYASEIINTISPEHIHIHLKKHKNLFKNINNAGGIFLGEYSTEAFGDYIVGTNHVLPTSGAAKFSSGLGVLDFMKRNSVVEMNQKSFNLLSKDTQIMSDVEGLDGHKMSVKIRQKK